MHHKQCLIADSARFLVQIEADILPATNASFMRWNRAKPLKDLIKKVFFRHLLGEGALTKL